jgi:AcrR family transcriptional regulator
VTDIADAILNATQRCVASGGFAALTGEAIAQRAHISRSTLYRCFPGGRNEIVAAFLRREFDDFFVDLYEQVKDIPEVNDLMVTGLMHARRQILSHPVLHVALNEDAAVLDSVFEDVIGQIMEEMATFLFDHLPESPWRAERSRYLARMGLSFMSSPGAWQFTDRRQVEDLVRCEMLPLASPTVVTRARVRTTAATVSHPTMHQRVATALVAAYIEGDSLSMESIARRADVSRATLYRTFPGGRSSLIATAVEVERGRVLARIAHVVTRADALDTALVTLLGELGRYAQTIPIMAALRARQPDLLRDQLRFAKGQRNFSLTTAQIAPLLALWVGDEASERLVDWMLRIVVSYWMDPSDELDFLSWSSVESFYGRHLSRGVAELVALPANSPTTM